MTSSPAQTETGTPSLAMLAEAELERQQRLRLRAQARYDSMRAGPYLEENGIGGLWVVIPSDWFNEEARRFWASIGCRYLPHERKWVRSVQLAYQGKTYTAPQWLRSIRRKFFELHEEELRRREGQEVADQETS